MKVYHGSVEVVEHPLVNVGRANLDFGPGFYLTDIRSQAEEWANRVSARRQLPPLINVYRLNVEEAIEHFSSKFFFEYDGEWLDFIVASRLGQCPWKGYDYIEGGVANDRVIDTITLYMNDLMTREKALERLSEHRPNNQICLLNQELVDKCLVYEGTENIG